MIRIIVGILMNLIVWKFYDCMDVDIIVKVVVNILDILF